MPLKILEKGIELPATSDFHVHLRDGEMSRLVVPTIRQGGVNTVFVMPNLLPPISQPSAAIAYCERLRAIDPTVNYLMSLYLHPMTTSHTIREAANMGITGVKSYPAGVTTNSSSGVCEPSYSPPSITQVSPDETHEQVLEYDKFFKVFAEMEKQDLVLNLHGELPSGGPTNTTVLTAEEEFLPKLAQLHKLFPDLRIVLEHCTTAAAIEAVKRCGPNVVGTITAHHLSIVVDDWAGDPFCFCKPVAKTPADRDALLRTVVSGNPKFFFGSDSAPHPATLKRGGDTVAAGVFTQPYATQYVLQALELAVDKGIIEEKDVTVEKLEGFLSGFGRKFYQLEPTKERIRLSHTFVKTSVEKALHSKESDMQVVPFRKGSTLCTLEWL